MADALAAMKQHFDEVIDEEFRRDASLHDIDVETAERLTRLAARTLIGNARWHLALGLSLTTRELADRWEVTRQALFERLKKGQLVALPGKRTNYYPLWQFDENSHFTHRASPIVERILHCFVEEMGEVDSEAVISWAATPQPELKGRAPRDVIADPAFASRLLRAARIAAREFAE